ncbi:MAG: undecaprenyldiphospho-muramoylpentapeptide beta-N-acetylglucosaminyltransferase [Oligoflexia bacterium]|nr:undecaprenyldiphospho-muramoylpentapeptide beta-N-acetylglucosaminyltransferase [Oligoflexia bacterium]
MILIAGGGTGGHIYPAIAIAQAIKEIRPDINIEFVGTAGGLEKKIIPKEGYKLHLIQAAALNNVSIISKIFALFLLPVGIIQSIFLILKLKPKVILGVGGYASGPMMLAGVLMCKKTAVFESNAFPGLTNRKLAHFVNVAFINFEVTKKFFKNALLLGIPVRKSMELKLRHEKNFITAKMNLLIFGGSQGARGINKVVLEAVKKDSGWLRDFNVIHQIGATDWEYFDSEYKKIFKAGMQASFQWFEFLYDMPERYQWADFVLCRAGAATLSELSAIGKAAILVPFPHAADNHQEKNAQALVERGAAHMVLQKDLSVERFLKEIYDFKNNPQQISQMAQAVKAFHFPDASHKIAEKLVNL